MKQAVTLVSVQSNKSSITQVFVFLLLNKGICQSVSSMQTIVQ